jgi:predicted nicotinamide N-methyase
VVVASGRWWAPVFAVLISLWIVVGGTAAGQMTPNFRSGNAGTVAGTAVMTLGLTLAAVAGIVAMLAGRQARERAAAR